MYEANIFEPNHRYTLYIACMGIVLASISANPFPDPFCESYSEQFSECVNPCNTCVQRGHCLYDRPPCYSGCDCIDGYFRNQGNECIPQEYCEEVVCPPNEGKTHCVRPCNDCYSKGDCEFFSCQPGCDCYQGFYRNISGHCVPEESCSMDCPNPNEEYNQCMPTCHNTCENFNSAEECVMVECIPGCACKYGYVRRVEDNICVPISSCRSPCGPNESLQSCSDACNTCRRRKTNCRDINCDTSSCECIAGYTRDDNGRCIPINECPVTNTPVSLCSDSEVFYDCVPYCRNTCENFFNDKVVCPTDCESGCFCKEGLLKDQNGECIPFNRCKPNKGKCKENEVFHSCFGTCEETCAELLSYSSTCTIPYTCKSGCFCEDGFYRSADGRCVTEEECKNLPSDGQHPPFYDSFPSVHCGITERYYECIPDCQRNCARFSSKPPRCREHECISGCFCKDGLYKRNDGKCVPIEKCATTRISDNPPKDDEKEECKVNEQFYRCKPDCLNTCGALDKNLNLNCFSECNPGCFCSHGLFQTRDGQCVRPADCPNEDGTLPATMSRILKNDSHGDSDDTNTAAATGSCMHLDETYHACMPICEHSCETLVNERSCKADECLPGCFCRHNLYRGPDGACVRADACFNYDGVISGKNNLVTVESSTLSSSIEDDESQLVNTPSATTVSVTGQPSNSTSSMSNTPMDPLSNSTKTDTPTLVTHKPGDAQNSTEDDSNTDHDKIVDSILKLFFKSLSHLSPSSVNDPLPTSVNDTLATTTSVVTMPTVTTSKNETNVTSTAVTPEVRNDTLLSTDVPVTNKTASKLIEPQTATIPSNIQTTESQSSAATKSSEEQVFSILGNALQVIERALQILPPLNQLKITSSTPEISSNANQKTSTPPSATTATAGSTKPAETTRTTGMTSALNLEIQETNTASSITTNDTNPLNHAIPFTTAFTPSSTEVILNLTGSKPVVDDKKFTLTDNQFKEFLFSFLNHMGSLASIIKESGPLKDEQKETTNSNTNASSSPNDTSTATPQHKVITTTTTTNEKHNSPNLTTTIASPSITASTSKAPENITTEDKAQASNKTTITPPPPPSTGSESPESTTDQRV